MRDTQPPARISARRVRIAAIAFLSLLAVGSATPAPGQETPSAERGHLIVVGGGPGGAGAACFVCHGLQGQGDAGTAFPRLAGLDAHYIARAMADYASGARPNPAMTPIAQRLTPADHQSVALYYAGLPVETPLAVEAGDPGLIQAGAVLYAQGSAERGIQACANCHGPVGTGLNRTYPAIAGQPAAYTAEQLLLFREGARHADTVDVMGPLAQRMSDEDIRAVSAYLAMLAP